MIDRGLVLGEAAQSRMNAARMPSRAARVLCNIQFSHMRLWLRYRLAIFTHAFEMQRDRFAEVRFRFGDSTTR